MKRFLWWQIILCPSIVIKAIIAFAICCVYALIRMNLFPDLPDASTIESLLLLVGSVIISNIIVNVFSRRNK